MASGWSRYIFARWWTICLLIQVFQKSSPIAIRSPSSLSSHLSAFAEVEPEMITMTTPESLALQYSMCTRRRGWLSSTLNRWDDDGKKKQHREEKNWNSLARSRWWRFMDLYNKYRSISRRISSAGLVIFMISQRFSHHKNRHTQKLERERDAICCDDEEKLKII